MPQTTPATGVTGRSVMGEQLGVRLDHERVAIAAELLSWSGVVLPELSLLGCRVLPVVEPDEQVHWAREAGGDGPQRDWDTLAIWEWPQSVGHFPAPALRLVGILVPATTWRRGLAIGGTWRGFGPVAVLTATRQPVTEVCRLEFQLRGVGLITSTSVTAQPVLAVTAAKGRQLPARRLVSDRWIEETLYEYALNLGVYSPQSQPRH